MKERPILFSGPMVSAILGGRKTQTRRIVNPQPSWNMPDMPGWSWNYKGSKFRSGLPTRFDCPHGKPGDRLWVRETWAAFDADGRHPGKPDDIKSGPWPNVIYKSDCVLKKYMGLWRPSIHMPRWASRIDLEITNVRVERLLDISEEDAIAEGMKIEIPKGCVMVHSGRPHRDIFEYKWHELYGDSLESNPWVWVVEFKRI